MSEPPAWLDGALWAPSAHNTQPWTFHPDGQGSVVVRWDPSRALPAGDPTRRDLWLGLGAAIEAAVLAAAVAGTRLEVTPRYAEEDRAVAILTPVEGQPDVADARLGLWLDVRRTGRGPHSPRPLPPALLDTLRAEATHWGYAFAAVQDSRSIAELARLARRATAALYADRGVHAELWRWLRLTPREERAAVDGLTASCLGLSGMSRWAARVALRPAVMRALAIPRLHHLAAWEAGATVRRSTALCLLTGSEDETFTGRIEAGRCLLRLWLLATEAGCVTHPISAILDCAKTSGQAARLFDAGAGQPLALFRLGYVAGGAPPRSSRLPVDSVWQSSPRLPVDSVWQSSTL